MTGCVDPEKSTLDIAGMFNGSSVRVDQRFADSQAINAISGFATVKAHSETYRIFVHSDTHTTDSRNNLEYFIHQYRNALDCPVAIHLGDLTDAQNHWEFMKSAYTDIPQNPNKIGGDTLFVALGNHDIYFGQWEKFKKYWGGRLPITSSWKLHLGNEISSSFSTPQKEPLAQIKWSGSKTS